MNPSIEPVQYFGKGKYIIIIAMLQTLTFLSTSNNVNDLKQNI